MLCLRTCSLDGSSMGPDANGFRWPLTKGALVKPTRWDPNPSRDCGDGLHGIVIGKHSGVELLYHADPNVLWVVFRPIGGVVESSGKIRCEEAEVVDFGTREQIQERLREQGITGLPYSVLMGGNDSVLTGGVGSVLTGGDSSRLIGGPRSTLIGGPCSVLTGDHYSTLIGGPRSVLTGGDSSVLIGGYYSRLIGGPRSTLIGGPCSTLTGDYGSTLTGDYGSTLTGDYGSTLSIRWHDGKRFRTAVAYVGEDGILPNVPYRVNHHGKFERV
jgi:hypothetical protein